jgi:hypothetical protein
LTAKRIRVYLVICQIQEYKRGVFPVCKTVTGIEKFPIFEAAVFYFTRLKNQLLTLMRKALLIGIDNYPSSPLKSCIRDAFELAKLLELNGDDSPNFDVRLLTDVPSKSLLLGHIKNLFNSDHDVVLFYYAGHGHINSMGSYLVTPDSRMNDEGVSMQDILKIANRSAAKNKIIILDCCHSGAMGTPDGSMAELAEGVTILAASRSSESSVELNGHGVFTNLLLNALQGGAADISGCITPGNIYAYIDRALGSWDQRPVFKTNITRFVSLRKMAPQVPIDLLRLLANYFPEPGYHYPLDPEHEKTFVQSLPEKTEVFEHLQQYESVGLVVPVGEKHMYWAAMRNQACRLTPLGHHYWQLVKSKRI